MNESPLSNWVKAVPFAPFTVTMSSGRTVAISSAEQVILGRQGDMIGFTDEHGHDRWVLVQHAHVNTVDAYDRTQSAAG